MHHDPAVIEAVAEVNRTAANAIALRQRVEAIYAPIFAKYEFWVSDEWRGDEPDPRINDHRHLYLSDQDELIKQFWDECDAALRAEHEYTMAKLELIRLTVKALEIPHPTKIEHQNKLVEIVLLLFAATC